jgi:hypothetical protein
MGNWNITIRGVGCHHNEKLPNDANRLAAQFVQVLKDAGHHIESASFTFGGEDVLNNPKTYLDGLVQVGYANDEKEARSRMVRICVPPGRANDRTCSEGDENCNGYCRGKASSPARLYPDLPEKTGS